jgi:hypothetical protein
VICSRIISFAVSIEAEVVLTSAMLGCGEVHTLVL